MAGCDSDLGGLVTPSDGGSHQDARTPGEPEPTPDLSCEVLIVGGTLGGVAAAHEAASSGARTCLVSLEDWLGGQATAQGVPFDEGFLQFSKTYAELRASIRQVYVNRGNVKPASLNNAGDEGPENPKPSFNPGSCWVSRLCAEPAVVRKVIEEDLLRPLSAAGGLDIRKGYRPTSVVQRSGALTGVHFSHRSGTPLYVTAQVIIDATELGDLFPLSCTDCYHLGMEASSETAEPDAPAAAYPECVQPFTYSFALELTPAGEDHSIPRPAGYDAKSYAVDGDWAGHVFVPNANNWSFWSYRRTLAAANFTDTVPADVAMINWDSGNDFNRDCGPDGCNILDKPAEVAQRILARGKQRALGFLYYLQHDVPRDDKTGSGYPNLKLRPDLFDTADGLARTPYIREARRLRAVTVVKEHNLTAVGARAQTRYGDTVGLARYYALDRHPCGSGPAEQTTITAGAAQVPLGALIPEQLDGLLAGSLNLGTTHITNGFYRLHPVEWNIGQAAGALAALSVRSRVTPRQLRADPGTLRTLQHHLVSQRGGPLYWWSDVHRTDPYYVAAQMMGATGVVVGDTTLAFKPEQPLTRAEAAQAVVQELQIAPVTECHAVFSDVPCSHPAYGAIQALADRRVTSGVGAGLYGPEQTLSRGQLVIFLVRAACSPQWDVKSCPLVAPATPSYPDVPVGSVYFGYVETARSRGWLDDTAAGSGFTPDGPATRRQGVTWLFAHLRRALALP